MIQKVTHIALGLILCLLAGLCLPGCERKKYPSGRDTIESFGDGRFQIGWVGESKGLSDGENELVDAIQYLCDWKKKGDWVYMVNVKGEYAVLNYRTAYYKKFKSFQDVPQPYREACEKLRIKKGT